VGVQGFPTVAAPDALEAAAAIVGDRWVLLIVDVLAAGPARFGDLLGRLEGLAPNVLSKRLKALEEAGVVVATPYSHRPLRLHYALSPAGQELADVLRHLAQWGAAHVGGEERPGQFHDACGTPLQARWWCPTCDRLVDDDEADDVHHV
jgi:DNA-binding HxlR family transcriptional regulator